MNTFGNKLKVTVFGESHAEAIGVTVDGLPAGTPIDETYIQSLLDLRAPGKSNTATRRKERGQHAGRATADDEYISL